MKSACGRGRIRPVWRPFPYEELVRRNRELTRDDLEFELLDTNVFDGDRYFEVVAEYAKESLEDILALVTVHNRGPETAPIHVLPTIWFPIFWAQAPGALRPLLCPIDSTGAVLAAAHSGTKAAAHYRFEVPTGESVQVRFRLSDRAPTPQRFGSGRRGRHGAP